jgi:hypothetical protein
MPALLYQHLSAEAELRAAYERACSTADALFTRDTGRFEGFKRTYEPFKEDDPGLPPESKEVATTVPAVLRKLRDAAVAISNYEVVRDEANCRATADVVAGGETLGKNLPSQSLMTLSRRLKEIRAIYAKALTLDHSIDWEKSTKKEVFKHGPTFTIRTAKTTVPIIMHEGNEHHPPQVHPEKTDEPQGKRVTVTTSGAIPEDFKEELLKAWDTCIIAVKNAHQRANRVEVTDVDKAMDNIFNFVHKTALAEMREETPG